MPAHLICGPFSADLMPPAPGNVVFAPEGVRRMPPKFVKPKPLESAMQLRCVKYARRRGFLATKLDHDQGWPDYLFIGQRAIVEPFPGGLPDLFMVEFKQLGEKPRPHQARMHVDLMQRRVVIVIIDSYKQFVSYLASTYPDLT